MSENYIHQSFASIGFNVIKTCCFLPIYIGLEVTSYALRKTGVDPTFGITMLPKNKELRTTFRQKACVQPINTTSDSHMHAVAALARNSASQTLQAVAETSGFIVRHVSADSQTTEKYGNKHSIFNYKKEMERALRTGIEVENDGMYAIRDADRKLSHLFQPFSLRSKVFLKIGYELGLIGSTTFEYFNTPRVNVYVDVANYLPYHRIRDLMMSGTPLLLYTSNYAEPAGYDDLTETRWTTNVTFSPTWSQKQVLRLLKKAVDSLSSLEDGDGMPVFNTYCKHYSDVVKQLFRVQTTTSCPGSNDFVEEQWDFRQHCGGEVCFRHADGRYVKCTVDVRNDPYNPVKQYVFLCPTAISWTSTPMPDLHTQPTLVRQGLNECFSGKTGKIYHIGLEDRNVKFTCITDSMNQTMVVNGSEMQHVITMLMIQEAQSPDSTTKMNAFSKLVSRKIRSDMRQIMSSILYDIWVHSQANRLTLSRLILKQRTAGRFMPTCEEGESNFANACSELQLLLSKQHRDKFKNVEVRKLKYVSTKEHRANKRKSIHDISKAKTRLIVKPTETLIKYTSSVLMSLGLNYTYLDKVIQGYKLTISDVLQTAIDILSVVDAVEKKVVDVVCAVEDLKQDVISIKDSTIENVKSCVDETKSFANFVVECNNLDKYRCLSDEMSTDDFTDDNEIYESFLDNYRSDDENENKNKNKNKNNQNNKNKNNDENVNITIVDDDDDVYDDDQIYSKQQQHLHPNE